MSDVTVTQVARNFADYVNRVAYRRPANVAHHQARRHQAL